MHICAWWLVMQRYDLIVGSATVINASKTLRLYTVGKNMECLKTQWKHSSLTSQLTWNGYAPTANFHYGFHATLMCSAMDENNKEIYRNVSIFKTSPNLFYTFQSIYRYIVKLWTYCVCSTIHYWHNAKFATGCLKTIWALNQNGTKVWLKVQYFCHFVSQQKSSFV